VKERRFVFTPAWLIYAALVAEGLLLLSQMSRESPFGKGWPALICSAIAAITICLLVLWFIASRVFQWRFQFGLRPLLVSVLVVAIACGWLASAMGRARRQTNLVGEASKLGCGVLYDYNVTDWGDVMMVSGTIPGTTPLNALVGDDFFREIAGAQPRTDDALRLFEMQPSVRRLDINDSQVTDAGLESIEGLKRLEWLDLRDAPLVTDAGLKHIRGLSRLRQLLLRRTSVSDAGMVYLKDLKDLQVLDLGMTKVTDAGLKNVAELTRLRMVLFWSNKIEDAGLTYIQRMTQLEILDLGFAPVTDAGLEKLQHLEQLHSLGLRGSAVTDAGLSHLEGLRQLRELDLYKTRITDAGLKHLEGLSNLQQLRLGETQVTAEGRKKLQRSLPSCKIEM
jgi:hypothetical protein